jgi:hypothetical protein
LSLHWKESSFRCKIRLLPSVSELLAVCCHRLARMPI